MAKLERTVNLTYCSLRFKGTVHIIDKRFTWGAIHVSSKEKTDDFAVD